MLHPVLRPSFFPHSYLTRQLCFPTSEDLSPRFCCPEWATASPAARLDSLLEVGCRVARLHGENQISAVCGSLN
jgi:hypothetical protein